ncbi:hypothetical protein ANO11243_001920 [Dothideomycetidae sp. 11243]|nr:hypothetical protein ANO11243_001920 [fungal sp. No.11243]
MQLATGESILPGKGCGRRRQSTAAQLSCGTGQGCGSLPITRTDLSEAVDGASSDETVDGGKGSREGERGINSSKAAKVTNGRPAVPRGCRTRFFTGQ